MRTLVNLILFLLTFLATVAWQSGVMGAYLSPLGSSTLIFDLPRPLFQALVYFPLEAIFLALATVFFVRLLLSPANRPLLAFFMLLALGLIGLTLFGLSFLPQSFHDVYPAIRLACTLWLPYTLAFALLQNRLVLSP